MKCIQSFRKSMKHMSINLMSDTSLTQKTIFIHQVHKLQDDYISRKTLCRGWWRSFPVWNPFPNSQFNLPNATTSSSQPWSTPAEPPICLSQNDSSLSTKAKRTSSKCLPSLSKISELFFGIVMNRKCPEFRFWFHIGKIAIFTFEKRLKRKLFRSEFDFKIFYHNVSSELLECHHFPVA